MSIVNDESPATAPTYIERAILDTTELINYAAKTGLKVKQETLDTLIKAKAAWEQSKWTQKIEISFWGAFNQLSRDVKPNVSTLYTMWTLFVLSIVLVFQIYWLIGNHLSTRLTELLTNETELANAIIQTDLDYASVEVRFKLLEADNRDSQASGSYEFYNTPDWERETAEIVSNRQKLENELEALRTKLERNSDLLLQWSTPWRDPFVKEEDIPPNEEIAEQIEALKNQIAAAEQQLNAASVDKLIHDRQTQLETWESELGNLEDQLTGLNDELIASQSLPEGRALLEEEKVQIRQNIRETQEWLNQPNLADIVLTQRQTELNNLKTQKAALERQQKRETIREKARRVILGTDFTLIALQSYLLPVLYGLLGASVYVLRSIEQEAEMVTFSPNHCHLLRLALGTIAGLMIGWFVSLFPDQSLSIPLSALAFIAGYNIEFLFSQMDKVINQSRAAKTNNKQEASNSVTSNGTTINGE